MSQAGDLITRVQEIVQDESYTDQILTFLNQAITVITSRLKLPTLAAYADVTTGASTAASGTITVASTGPVADETLTIDGKEFTFKAVDVSPYEIKIGATVALTAGNIKKAINAVMNSIRATAADGVVTVTAVAGGDSGNSVTLAESASNITLSGATLSGGTTGSPRCSLPSDFGHSLHSVSSDAQERYVKVFRNYAAFLRRYPRLNRIGPIRACCIEGSVLLYQPIPTSADTLTLHYQQTPQALVAETDVPDYLPDHFQEPLLVNHAAAQIFNELEEQGNKVNYQAYMARFEDAMAGLRAFWNIPPEEDMGLPTRTVQAA